MMASPRCIAILAWFCAFTCLPAHAWNDAGHMLAARAAYRTLTVAERNVWVEVLVEHPRFEVDFARRMPKRIDAEARGEWLFAQAGTWPDLARHFSHVRDRRTREALVERYHRGSWHYVNVVLEVDSAGQIQQAETVRFLPGPAGAGPGDILEALAHLQATWSPAESAERAIALCWILHLMADLHQPLHTTALVAPGTLAEGDRGGNEIRLANRRGRAGPRNLHALWDAAVGRSRGWDDLDRRLMSLAPAPRIDGYPPPADFRAWALEGAAVAREFAYPSRLRVEIARASTRQEPARYTADELYLESMGGIARDRIGLSAQRTVHVLRALVN